LLQVGSNYLTDTALTSTVFAVVVELSPALGTWVLP